MSSCKTSVQVSGRCKYNLDIEIVEFLLSILYRDGDKTKRGSVVAHSYLARIFLIAGSSLTNLIPLSGSNAVYRQVLTDTKTTLSILFTHFHPIFISWVCRMFLWSSSSISLVPPMWLLVPQYNCRHPIHITQSFHQSKSQARNI